MKTLTLLAVFLVLLCALGTILTAANPASVVAESERAFSKLAGEKGIRTAFLTYLAEDSIVFQKTPESGRALYEKRPETPAVLFWQPAVVDISAAGDLGYSTGPWEYSPKPGEKPVAFGDFASIWKKQPDGSWRVFIDQGCTHGPNPTPVAELVKYEIPAKPAGKTVANMDAAKEKSGLLDADRRFSMDAAGGTNAAYDAWLVSDARMLREGIMPAGSAEERKAALDKSPGKLAWEPIDGGIAASGDLGYTYGTYSRVADSAEEKGHYLRAWKRQNDGKWKVALDVFAPMPQ